MNRRPSLDDWSEDELSAERERLEAEIAKEKAKANGGDVVELRSIDGGKGD